MSESTSVEITREPPTAVTPHQRPQPSWGEIGDSFETMGKVGLALAIGMSAAGLFCKLADQGKVKLPTLSSLILSRQDSGPSEVKIRSNPSG